MPRLTRSTALFALCCAVAGTVLAGCDEDSDDAASNPAPSPTAQASPAGPTKITVDGQSVNTFCSGTLAAGKPVIVLMAGAGDGLEKMAGIQKTLSEKNRVCAYDRLGEGASDKPTGPQSFASSGKILTGVLDKVAGGSPVVLAGHSLGGLVAARYTPDHQDKVKGLVLLDATPPNAVATTLQVVPESAKSPALDLRTQMVQMSKGENDEKLTIVDGAVHSAGAIPVEVIKHGPAFLTSIPDYGTALEKLWSDGQQQWLALSSNSKLSTAEKSSHYIYVDQPDVAVQAIERVTAQAGS